MRTRTITLDSHYGDEITATIAKAIKKAADCDCRVAFEFNGVKVVVTAESDPALIYRDWSRGMNGYHHEQVGPCSPAELTEKQKQRDAEVKAENERKERESRQKYERKMNALREAAERETEGVELALSNSEAWRTSKEKNQDAYGGAVISYAERWAKLMQARMAGGQSLAECAEQASFDADVEGITGFMHGAAVSTLAGCWAHGDELRKWHNRKYDVNDEEKGVVNPAVLTIG